MARPRTLTKTELEVRSEFRHQLRRFECVGEEAARAHGITFTQYLLLLHLAGMPGRDWATVGELAERLQLAPHSTVGLVTRCEAAALVQRRPSAADRRQVEVHLTRPGRAAVMAIAAALEDELGALYEHLGAVRSQK